MKGNIYNNYRAQRFDEIVGQQELVENIRNQSRLNAFFHAYLLVGWYGSGKTTVARLIAMAANCEHKDENGNPCGECPACRVIRNGTCGDVLEIDGATNTGADNIRSLRETLPYAPLTVRKKIVIIDEVHMLSTAAFNALLKIVEEAPEHVIFIFATTEEEKVLATIKSRCFTYTFGKIPTRLIADHVKKVAASEEIDITDGAASLIARSSDGAMRNALKLLEQVSGTGRQVTEAVVASVVGGTDSGKVMGLLLAVLHSERRDALDMVTAFAQYGKNLSVLCSELLSAVSDVVRIRCGKDVCASDGYIEKLALVTEPLDLLFDIMPLIQDMKQALKDDASEAVFLAGIFGVMKQIEVMTGKRQETKAVPAEEKACVPVTPEPESEPLCEGPVTEEEPVAAETGRGGAVIETDESVDDPFALLDGIGGGAIIEDEEKSDPFVKAAGECGDSGEELPMFLNTQLGISEDSRAAIEGLRYLAREYRAVQLTLENGVETFSIGSSGVTILYTDPMTEKILDVFVDRYGLSDKVRLISKESAKIDPTCGMISA